MNPKEYLLEVGEKIQRVYNPELIEIIVCRYIRGLTQEQVAEKMNVSISYLKKQEKLALQIFEIENNV